MKLSLGLALLLLPLLQLAQNNALLYSGDGRPFRVYINDKPYKTAQASVLIENIKKDTLYLKAEFEGGQRQGLTIYLMEQGRKTSGKEFDFRIDQGKQRLRLSFTGVYDLLPMPDPLVPRQPVVDTTSIYKHTRLGHLVELKEGRISYFNNLPKQGLCTAPMPDEYLAFTGFLLSKTGLEEDRIRIIQNVCLHNCLSQVQLKKLMSYIDQDLERLEVLRLGFRNLVDTVNKKSLGAALRFDAARVEMNSFFTKITAGQAGSPGPCSKPSGSEEVERLATELALPENDNQRLSILKKNFSRYCYDFEQVKSLMSKFLHDREKLEAAKLLYYHCVEKEKFPSLASEFAYALTVDDLNAFIKKQQG